MKKNKKNKIWVVEAMVYNNLVKVTSDGTSENTVIDASEATQNRIINAIRSGKETPYIYDGENIPADYTPLGMMSAIESLARGRVAFTIIPAETLVFLRKNYGEVIQKGWLR